MWNFNMANDIQTFTVEEAIKQIKLTDKSKFDATVEAHINLGIDPKKNDQSVRTTTTLPNGTGKEVKVAVFASKTIKDADIQLSEADLTKIEKGKLKPGVDFDVIVSEPKFMPKIAKVAKILGPQGMMPNPKSGTVTEDVEKAVKQIKGGKVEIRNEINAPIIHTILGKVSFDDKKLKENYTEVMNSVNQARPQKIKPENYIKSIFLKSTMGKSYMIEL